MFSCSASSNEPWESGWSSVIYASDFACYHFRAAATLRWILRCFVECSHNRRSWQAKHICEIGKFCQIFSSIAIFQTHKLITETLGIIHFTIHRIHCEFFSPHLSTTLDTRVNKMLNKFSFPWNHHKEREKHFPYSSCFLRHFIHTLYL